MSYSGTVRCGHCWNKGHNKRSCPELKQYVKDNPDSFAAKRAAIAKERAEPRRCTYCAQQGHNRATCGTLNKDVNVWQTKNATWIKKLVKVLEEEGIGVGSLIRHTGGAWNYRDKPVMVLALHQAHMDDMDHLFQVAPITNLTQRYWVSVPDGIAEKTHIVDGNNYGYRRSYEDMTLLAGTDKPLLNTLTEVQQKEWLAGGNPKKIKKVIFKERTSSDYSQNRWA